MSSTDVASSVSQLWKTLLSLIAIRTVSSVVGGSLPSLRLGQPMMYSVSDRSMSGSPISVTSRDRCCFRMSSEDAAMAADALALEGLSGLTNSPAGRISQSGSFRSGLSDFACPSAGKSDPQPVRPTVIAAAADRASVRNGFDITVLIFRSLLECLAIHWFCARFGG